VSLRVASLAFLVLGVGLMTPFATPVTLALGVLFLLAFIASGVLVVAGPGAPMLDPGDDQDRERDRDHDHDRD
jgi:hypothetical protein